MFLLAILVVTRPARGGEVYSEPLAYEKHDLSDNLQVSDTSYIQARTPPSSPGRSNANRNTRKSPTKPKVEKAATIGGVKDISSKPQTTKVDDNIATSVLGRIGGLDGWQCPEHRGGTKLFVLTFETKRKC